MRQEHCTVISSNISFTRGLPIGDLCIRNLLKTWRSISFSCIWFANKYLGAYSPQMHNVSLPLLISTLYLSLDLTDGLCIPSPHPTFTFQTPSSGELTLPALSFIFFLQDPGHSLSNFHSFFFLIFATTLEDGYYGYPYFTLKKTEDQRS